MAPSEAKVLPRDVHGGGMSALFRTKAVAEIVSEAESSATGPQLRRTLGAADLVMLGIGGVIGAGIFSAIGTAAVGEVGPDGTVIRYGAGPALVVSFILLGAVCGLAGLCYAELTALIPISGSAYTYAYATLGEIVAWIIGWDLILEYAFGAATVASGWSSTLVAFLQDYGINLTPQICDTPGAPWAMVDGRWFPESALKADQLARATQHAH